MTQVMFKLLEGLSHSSVQVKACFSILKKGRHLSIALETNLFSAAILSVNFWTSFTVLGDVISSMTCTFSKFASIPL